jgi:hypothetical protein
LCIDWDDEDPYLFYGKDKDVNHQYIDVAIVPCNHIHDEFDKDTTETVPDNCNTDLEQQFDYLTSSISLMLLHNNERFDAAKFGDDKIVRESLI